MDREAKGKVKEREGTEGERKKKLNEKIKNVIVVCVKLCTRRNFPSRFTFAVKARRSFEGIPFHRFRVPYREAEVYRVFP